MKKRLPVILIIAMTTILAPDINGALMSITADDSGFFNAAGRSSKNDGFLLGAADAAYNYSVGAIDEVPPLSGSDLPRKNFFVFDLTGITDDISGAALELYNPSGGYSSPDASEDYAVSGIAAASLAEMATFASDISMTYDITDAGELASATTLFGELAAIPDFGIKTISAADDDSMITISLDAAGVDYLNMFKGGKVVIAGFIATLDGTPGADEVVFGFTKPLPPGATDPGIISPTPTPLLHIDVVPEPSSVSLLAIALGACLIQRKR